MDSLQDWPEPVVRVQSLSDSGATVIPLQYVKPPSERSVVHGGSGNHDLSIPVVDFNCTDTVSAVSDACKVWGFFQVINHGVSHELMRRAREDWRRFFHLPMEEKQMYANSPKTYEGYGSRLGTQKGAILDWGDYYYLHLLPLSLKSHDKWPSLPPSLRYKDRKTNSTIFVFSFRTRFMFLLIYKYSTEFTRGTVEEYGREAVSFCERVMKVLALGLGLDEGRLQTAFGGKESGVCMRVNFYPKCPQPDLTLGLSSHSDPGGITVLLPDDRVKGLQVRRGDAWVTVKPVPDSFIVNVGDQIQVLSNATYKSVEHRVTVNSETERLSIAFFYNPKSDLPLAPLPEFVTPDRPSLYQPMTFDQYRLYIRQRGPKGKSQVESLKAA